MAKSRKLEALLAQLDEVRSALPPQGDANPNAAATQDRLRQVLQSKVGVAIAQAARLISQHEFTDLIPDLVAAFEQAKVNPAKTDPNCLGKTAIADALYRLDYSNEALFLQGIHHVQMEPVWGGQEDTAATLRGTCALGLVRMNYPDVMTELADLLADPEAPARIAAARAIAYSGSPHGVPLLRLRARIGDDPPVVAECLAALLKLAPLPSVPFVAEFLHHLHPQTQELTALALGESRLPEALPPLQHWWAQTPDPELQKTALLAIATLRLDDALQFLLTLLTDSNRATAQAAFDALSIYQQDTALWQEVRSRYSSYK